MELELEDVSNEVSSFVMNFVGGYLGTYVHILMCCSGRNSIGISKNIGLENISILLIVLDGPCMGPTRYQQGFGDRCFFRMIDYSI